MMDLSSTAKTVTLAACGVVLSGSLAIAAWLAERDKLQIHLDTAAEERARAIQTTLNSQLMFLNVLSIYYANADVDRASFESIVSRIRTEHAALRSVLWAPKVLDERREEFTQNRRLTDPNFTISQDDPTGGTTESPQRSQYFPVSQIDTQRATSLGFDLASIPQFAQEMRKAATLGQVLLGDIHPLGGRADSSGFFAYQALYDGNPATNSARLEALRGFFIGAIEISTLVRVSIGELSDSYIEFELVSAQKGQAPKTLYSQRYANHSPGILRMTTRTPVAATLGLDWYINARPGRDFDMTSPYINASIMFVLGLLVTTLGVRYKLNNDMRESLVNEIVASRTAELNVAHRKLEATSLTDSLTGLANRRYLDQELEREWARAMRDKTELAIAIIDVDHFKRYNDHHGHVAGDKVLRSVANVLAASFRRPSDIVARYGGEEFMVALPSIEGAEAYIERLVSAFERVKIPHGDSPTAMHVTISAGLAVCKPQIGDTLEAAVAKADEALYHAKKAGRNQMHCWKQGNKRLHTVA